MFCEQAAIAICEFNRIIVHGRRGKVKKYYHIYILNIFYVIQPDNTEIKTIAYDMPQQYNHMPIIRQRYIYK